MMENVNNKNLTVSDLINILDKEYNRRTSNGTERLLMIQVNGKCFGYLKSVKLDGYGSGLIADVCLELDTEKNDGWIPVDPNNLPDPEVLCCDRYGEQLIGYLSNTEEGFICESNECIMYDVVAWMDKPKPYKKDGE